MCLTIVMVVFTYGTETAQHEPGASYAPNNAGDDSRFRY